MRDHLEPLSVKPGFLDKEVGDWGLDVVVDNLLPPSAGDGIGFVVRRILESGPGQNGGQQSLALMIFLASIHESPSVISLSPKSKALSLMVVTAGNVVRGAGTGTDGSEDKSPRTEESRVAQEGQRPVLGIPSWRC